MTVSDSLKQRRSTRAFLAQPVASSLLKQLFETAIQAPSNCNIQPWKVYVASGATRDSLETKLLAEARANKEAYPDVKWLTRFDGEYKPRQFESAAALYGSMGIEREDRDARLQALLRNWSFFDAPHVAFFTMEKTLGYTGAVDLGIFAQSLALLMTEAGLGCCFQAALNQFPGPIHEALNIPPHQAILFGLSFGYPDPDAAANQTRTSRESLDTLVEFFD